MKSLAFSLSLAIIMLASNINIATAMTENGSSRVNKSDINWKEQEECSICLDEFKPGQEYSELRCKHVFHKNCLKHWFINSQVNNALSSCPLCRSKHNAIDIDNGGKVPDFTQGPKDVPKPRSTKFDMQNILENKSKTRIKPRIKLDKAKLNQPLKSYVLLVSSGLLGLGSSILLNSSKDSNHKSNNYYTRSKSQSFRSLASLSLFSCLCLSYLNKPSQEQSIASYVLGYAFGNCFNSI